MIKDQYGGAMDSGIIDQDGYFENESTPLQMGHEYIGSQRTAPEPKGWNVFRSPQIKEDSGSMESHDFLKKLQIISKLLVCLLVFAIVLCCSVIAGGTALLMTSQIRINRSIVYCNRLMGTGRNFVTTIPDHERLVWIWLIIIAFAVPEIGTLIRSTRICIFKYWERPKVYHFVVVIVMETLHVIGLAIMFMNILPNLNVIQGVMLTSCLCFVPGLFGLLSRNKRRDESKRLIYTLVDIVALAAQATGFVVWPLANISEPSLWLIPLALILISCGWWENYVSTQSGLFPIRSLGRVKEQMKPTKYFMYIFVSVWKIMAFAFSCVIIFYMEGNSVTYLFTSGGLFSSHNITVAEVQSTIGDGTIPDFSEILTNGVTAIIATDYTTPMYALAIQIFSAYFAYIFGKFACKIMIQQFSYALPVSLTIPVLLSLLVAACASRNNDPCYFHGIIPDYLFYDSPVFSTLSDFITKEYGWVWLLWMLSYTWITLHIWTPKCERLASTEKLFVAPMYNGLLINQSMALNRNRDDHPEVNLSEWTEFEDARSDADDDVLFDQAGNSAREPTNIERADSVTKIYACATMWHETKDEMLEFLKSILRLDLDQCARKNAQKFLKIVDPDYYEFETNIFFDDAFEVADHDENESQVNPFVKVLVDALDEAASNVHQTRISVRAPKKYPTPYGGRLVWTLPGNTKMIAHLKDKSKIRHRKRWSQVMYMYYLLGHRIMDLPISVARKEVIAENTYILALDGDIDFQPIAVKLLVDLMKKNAGLGAACGRIHPMGSGPMVWYQMFEYAIGHWLQKATEHVIGCVLCSPGCFSLFRAKALMDDNVMNTYTTNPTEARHYVQYDQGEDRWLCTLLLQRGYRVEYSAASDSYTHAPEGFNEFYNQRRRWMPSTMANIMDLLVDYKRIIKNNDNISKIYMFYQVLLMTGTIIGPGTIFLMLVGAFVSAFRTSTVTGMYFNVIPVLIFIIACFTCKSDIQLFLAAVISVFYGLVMMAVIVGLLLQMTEDGWVAPSSLFLLLVVSQIVIAGLMHPQELICLPCGIVYYVTIPSMYLLLSIYSITNLNNVTWGTREVKVKKTAAEIEAEKKLAEASPQKPKNNSAFGFLQNGRDDDQGSIEFTLAGLFRCIFCTYEKPSEQKKELAAISDRLDQVIKRLDTPESKPNEHQGQLPGWRANPLPTSRFTQDPMSSVKVNLVKNDQPDSDTDSTGSQETEANRKRTFLVSPYWLDDEGLKKGEVDFLSAREEQFWEDLIEEYLHPIDEDKAEKARIAGDLKNLRDSSAFAFLGLNTILVLTIFILELNQDLLHIRWPFGIQYTISFSDANLEVHIATDYLQLQPIGLTFVLFFGLVLVIQFIAMLFHRFGTFAHILASTKISGWFCCSKPEDITDDVLLSKDAVEIVKDLQRLDSLEEDYIATASEKPGRRNTVRNLEKSRWKPQKVNSNLDDTFRERFFSLSEGSGFPRNMSVRRSSKALKAFEVRRNTVLAERRKSRMQTVGEDSLYEMAGNRASVQHATARNSQISTNDIFDPNSSGVINLAFEPEDSLPGPSSSDLKV